MVALHAIAIEAIARAAHAGQVDKQGRDYMRCHILPVVETAYDIADALGLEDAERQIVIHAAYLHDIVEDTSWQLVDVAAAAGDDVAAVVESVTRGEETYAELITRACAHRLAAAVKLADNSVNIAAGLIHRSDDPQLQARFDSMRQRRYLPARERLLAALDLDAAVGDRLLQRAGDHLASLPSS